MKRRQKKRTKVEGHGLEGQSHNIIHTVGVGGQFTNAMTLTVYEYGEIYDEKGLYPANLAMTFDSWCFYWAVAMMIARLRVFDCLLCFFPEF